MKEINIKFDFDSIAEYLSEEEVVKIIKATIEKKINECYNHDINELIKSYLFYVLRTHTDNVFMNTPYMEGKIKESVEKCIENLQSYEVFRRQERGYWGDKESSVAQKVLDEYCGTDEFKEKLKNKIDTVLGEKIEQMELNDFIYMMADGMADMIRNNLIKPKGGDNE